MLKRLFEKAYIGNLELRNRIVMTAVHLGYADDAGFITERMVRFYEERAKGGVGLIIVGVCYTEPQGKHFPMQIGIDRDEVIFNLRELTGSIQKHGAKVCCQIGHGGRYDHPDISGAHPVAPSPIPAPIFTRGITPKELTIAEIQRIIDNFGVASRRVKEAGFDGVEIAASGGALISQFLSPVTNKRTDRYGGDLKNRLTFLLEIIKAIRGKVGKDYPLLVRICGHDMVSGSHTLKEQKTVAQEIEKAGADCINVNIGWEESPHPMLQMYVPRGAFVFLSNGIRSVVRIPVIGGIRVNDPLLAETILKEEKADLVTMCRPLIADPELPRKAMEGRLEDIRMCIGCNQRCLDNALTSVGVTCLVNVQAGREREFAIEPAPRSKKVLVIGGGPAGLEAARIAAIRGHEVKIIEKADKLGGKLNIGSIPPGKGELMLIPRYYSTLLPKLGVKVHLETEVTPKLIKDEKPEVVVVATGATPSTTKIPGVEGNNVITAED
ncbi:FAD-dependent oxidoreductase, partial [bacterium]|nr:FAD-dependent oxidoreductase [bacterium]